MEGGDSVENREVDDKRPGDKKSEGRGGYKGRGGTEEEVDTEEGAMDVHLFCTKHYTIYKNQ